MLKKTISTCSIISLTLLSASVSAETDPDYTEGVLTLPKVSSGETVFENVGLGLDFTDNSLSLLNFAISNDSSNAETDPDFSNDILTMPRAVSGDTLYTNVRLNLAFSPIPEEKGSFSLLEGFEAKSRFSSKTNGIDEVLIDNISKRTWVNGSHACMINADAVAHCESLDFAGYQNWRAPTSEEIADMIVNANKLEITLNYRNPNCQFMATSDGFVQTENTSEPGKLVTTAVNSGTRCVREE